MVTTLLLSKGVRLADGHETIISLGVALCVVVHIQRIFISLSLKASFAKSHKSMDLMLLYRLQE